MSEASSHDAGGPVPGRRPPVAGRGAMMDDSVLARVYRVVARTAGASRTPADAGPDTPLGDAGFWLDSVDVVEVIVACEAEFGVVLDGETDLTPGSLATVRDLAALIERKGSQ